MRESAKQLKTVVFTIASKNYFAYVRTLMQSLEKTNSHLDRYAVVVDDLDDTFISLPRNFELLDLDKLNLPHPNQMKFRYDIMELNTAVKPFAILKLFETYERVIYFDPDIYVYKKLKPIEDALDAGNNFVLTPHYNGLFEDDGMHPDEPDMMRAGIYNLGFIALNKCADTLEMVTWWADKLEKQCINEQSKGIFVDQKWIDLVPGFYDHVCILRHSGLNVAYWNLSHRKIIKNGDDFEVNGEPLIFFHFSGLNPNNISAISKYQNRYTINDLGWGGVLFEDYAEAVLSNGFDFWRKFKYSYELYDDGRKVLERHRKTYRENLRFQGYCGENPFSYADIFYGDCEIDFSKDGVNLIGYIRSEHGLGEAARLTAKCMEASGINWVAYDFEIGNSSKKNDNTYKEKIKDYIKYDISIININADQFPVLYRNMPSELWDTYKIGVWYWELPEFPDKYIGAFLGVDEIWAPSKFIADCLKKYAPCPVYHMPPGMDRLIVNTSIYSRDYFGLPENAFLFLNMFDVYSFTARKNPEASVKAFKSSFAPDDMSVGLVLKLNNSGYTDKVKKKLTELVKDYKNIYIIAQTLSREAINGLLNTCDVIVSLHRSEGVGFICEEAMFYGKPVIATGWSGNMDFMTSDCACLVGYEMCSVGEDVGPYEGWQLWADPSVEDAVMYMKKLYNDKAYYDRLSIAASRYIKENFSSDVCGKRMKRRLSEIRNLIDGGYVGIDMSKKAECFARSMVLYYQNLFEEKLSSEEKDRLVKEWVSKRGAVEFAKIGASLAESRVLKNCSDREYVIRLYEKFLLRTPSLEEIEPRLEALKSISRIDMTGEMIQTDEFLGYNIGLRKYYEDTSEDKDNVPLDYYHQMKYDLNNANLNYRQQYYFELNCRGFVYFIKKMIRKVNKFLIVPILDSQSDYNAHVVRCLNILHEWCYSMSEIKEQISVDKGINKECFDNLVRRIEKSEKSIVELRETLNQIIHVFGEK